MSRDERILKAVATSLLSKVSTVAIQILAMPLIARRLGPGYFGIYAALSAVPNWFSAADLGVGPALAHKIARGAAKDDVELQRRYFLAALFLLSSIAVLICAIGGGIAGFGITRLFGASFAQYRDTVRLGFLTIVLLLALQMIASIAVKVRTGFQEIHINNIFNAVENAAKVSLLAIIAWQHPSVILVLLAVYGTAVIAGGANLFALVCGRRYLVQFGRFEFRRAARELLSDSILYAVALGLLGLEREYGQLLLGRAAGVVEVGRFSILTSLITVMGGVVVMATTPIWPAIADAVFKEDHLWLQNMRRRLRRSAFLYGLVAMTVVGACGAQCVRLLYGSQYVIESRSFWLLGAYFFVVVQGHVRFIWLLGYAAIRTLAIVATIECFVTVALLSIAHHVLSINSVLVMLGSTHLLFSVFVQDAILLRQTIPVPRFGRRRPS